jgi:hypothetical protein
MFNSFVKRHLKPQSPRYDRRVTIAITADHAYTVKTMPAALAARGVEFVVMPYENLFRLPRIGGGAWIFTDFDRLSPTELECAGIIYHNLARAGLPVLNDPRLFRPRHALLAHLERAGMNRISVWWPATGEMPDRFPVLLRSIAGHRGPIGDLCHDPQTAATAVDDAIKAGYVLADLVFLSFAAEPDATGLWQKHAAFRVGDRIVRANTVNDTTWMAKHGAQGAATAKYYERELAEMTDYPHSDYVRRVFDAAGMTYGRVDFGIVGGQPEVYEINSNPNIPEPKPHPDPSRARTLALLEERMADALSDFAISASDVDIDLRTAFRRTKTNDNGDPRRY